MTTNRWIRQAHRWLSLLFTLAVIANFVAMGMGSEAQWVGYIALLPLIPLLFSGIYLFVLPYRTKQAADSQL